MFEKEIFEYLAKMQKFNRFSGVSPFAFSVRKRRMRWIQSTLFYFHFMLNRVFGVVWLLTTIFGTWLGWRILYKNEHVTPTFVLFLLLMSLFNPVLMLMDHIHWNCRHDIVSVINSFIALSKKIVESEMNAAADAEEKRKDETVRVILLHMLKIMHGSLKWAPIVAICSWPLYYHSVVALVREFHQLLQSVLPFQLPWMFVGLEVVRIILSYMYFGFGLVHRIMMFVMTTGTMAF